MKLNCLSTKWPSKNKLHYIHVYAVVSSNGNNIGFLQLMALLIMLPASYCVDSGVSYKRAIFI